MRNSSLHSIVLLVDAVFTLTPPIVRFPCLTGKHGQSLQVHENNSNAASSDEMDRVYSPAGHHPILPFVLATGSSSPKLLSLVS
jgi:hypothetical protein